MKAISPAMQMEIFWGAPSASTAKVMALCADQGQATNAALIAKGSGDMAKRDALWKQADNIEKQIKK
jgi:hypothetical protein